MKKYICTICGYIYDEAVEKVKFSDLPSDWKCPLCGATKSDFEEVAEKREEPVKEQLFDAPEEMKEMTNGEMSALCSNLAKGCEKQYLAEQQKLFEELAGYFKSKTQSGTDKSFDDLLTRINHNLENEFVTAEQNAENSSDRGAKRALTWSSKVTKILKSLIERYQREGDALCKNTNVYVCQICGFIYIGDTPPEVCPVCKVPSLKIVRMERR